MIGANNAQTLIAGRQYDERLRTSSLNYPEANLERVLTQLRSYDGFLPLLGYNGITRENVNPQEPQCPLGLAIVSQTYDGVPAFRYWQARVRGSNDPPVLPAPPVTAMVYGDPAAIRLEQRVSLR
jgi:hypothetical protein